MTKEFLNQMNSLFGSGSGIDAGKSVMVCLVWSIYRYIYRCGWGGL